jgi:hypothetical protein
MKRLTVIILFALLATLALGLGISSAQGPTFGTNWFGQFFVDTSFTTPGAFESYPSGLNFNWPDTPRRSDNATPVPGIPADNFSVRFTSSQTFQVGTYTFALNVDDQATVYVGGTQVFAATVPGTYSFQAQIAAAGNYEVRVDFVELSLVAVLQMSWQLGAGTGTALPPGATAGPTGPSGSVVSVRGLSLRTGPYLGASFIAVLRPDIAYPVLGRSNDEGGPFTWYRVQAGEQVGWASGRYLAVTGDVNSIPFEGNVFEQIDGAPDVGAVAIPRAVMNLRRRPSYRSQRLGYVFWGEEVQLIGRTISGGVDQWYQVRKGDQVGWIYAPFVTIRGNVLSVPFR